MVKTHQHSAHGAMAGGSVFILVACLTHGSHRQVSFVTEKRKKVLWLSHFRQLSERRLNCYIILESED